MAAARQAARRSRLRLTEKDASALTEAGKGTEKREEEEKLGDTEASEDDLVEVTNPHAALQGLRSEAGETMVLRDNFFIEKILPSAILRTLSDEEIANYRRPFAETGEGRRPTLTFPRQIPIEGEPADVVAIVTAYDEWLKTSSVPKLFLKAEPGGILSAGPDIEFARSLPAQTEVTVAGVHYVQEDSPDEIGRAIAGWMGALGSREPFKARVTRSA